MAYSRVTRTKNGASALKYAEGHGHGHNGNETRNEFISAVNMLSGVPYVQQMQRYWNKARHSHKTQAIRIVQSFSRNEFDPNSVDAGIKVQELGLEFAKIYYPKRQAVVFTQKDGKSGLWHNHIIVNDVEMKTYKGCDKHQYFFKSIEKWTNKVTSQYTTVDNGMQSTADKISRTERVKRMNNEYVWRDDLKARVHDAMDLAKSEIDFLDCLKSYGVGATQKTSKKYGEYFTYELLDTSNAPDDAKLPKRKLLGRSYKLGTSYGIDALRDVLKAKDTKKYKKAVSTAHTKTINDEKCNEDEDEEFNFYTWYRTTGETFYDSNCKIDWEKYEELQERYESILSVNNEAVDKVTNASLNVPHEPYTAPKQDKQESIDKVTNVSVNVPRKTYTASKRVKPESVDKVTNVSVNVPRKTYTASKRVKPESVDKVTNYHVEEINDNSITHNSNSELNAVKRELTAKRNAVSTERRHAEKQIKRNNGAIPFSFQEMCEKAESYDYEL